MGLGTSGSSIAKRSSVLRYWQSPHSRLILPQQESRTQPSETAVQTGRNDNDALRIRHSDGPAMTVLSFDDAVKHVLKTEPIFEITTADIRGVTYKVFKNISATVPALLRASHAAQDNGAAGVSCIRK